MPAFSGFICHDVATTSLSTTYASCLLHEDTTSDAKSIHGALPSAGAEWSHLELLLSEDSGTISSIDIYLTWDSGGDHIVAGATQTALKVVSGQTATYKMASVSLGISPRAPSVQTTAGKVYLWSKLDAGTGTLLAARLHWNLLPRR